MTSGSRARVVECITGRLLLSSYHSNHKSMGNWFINVWLRPMVSDSVLHLGSLFMFITIKIGLSDSERNLGQFSL